MIKPAGHCLDCNRLTESAWSDTAKSFRCADCGGPTLLEEDPTETSRLLTNSRLRSITDITSHWLTFVLYAACAFLVAAIVDSLPVRIGVTILGGIACYCAGIAYMLKFMKAYLNSTAYTCRYCKAVSRDPWDIAHRYCGACHRFLDGSPLQ